MDPDQINELSANPNAPLAMRMMEHLPGFTSSFFFAQGRGANTIIGGGFLDNRKRVGKLGGFSRGSLELTQPTSRAYYGTAARRSRLAAAAGTSEGKMALGKGARVNHITARPRALSRYHSLSIFNASENAATYSPFQMMAKTMGNQAKKSSAFKEAFYGGREIGKEEQVFQRGMLSMVTAGRKADLLERKALSGSSRALAKVGVAQEQVKRLALMNNPDLAQGVKAVQGKTYEFGRVLKKSEGAGKIVAQPYSEISLKGTGTYSESSFMGRALAGGNQVGLTGNLMASAGSTAGSRGVMGYFRGALGFADAGGLEKEALTGAQKAVSHLTTAINRIGLEGPGLAERGLQQGVFKTFATKDIARMAATREGAMVLGARTAAMAIPGLNLLATASLVYDLGKMGGELIKSGATLAKDAVKSMKGSIDKPVFGMGYKDNEIAATSRARGVMAIQNSRLNARSMLGSEAGMMAAHFG